MTTAEGSGSDGEGKSDILALLVEDDVRLASLTQAYLQRHEVQALLCHDGPTGLEQSRRMSFDIVLLDVMLPGMSGIEVCQHIRAQSDVPIIMITARTEEADRVMGLEIGADDYVSKPFSPRELLARIRAHVRRTRGNLVPQSRIVLGDLTLDPGARSVLLNGSPVDLTSYEFSLLHALVKRAGRVLGREQLMQMVRGTADEAFDRSIDVHISRLRQKLLDDPRHPTRIKTVRSVGYLYAMDKR